MVDKKEDKKNKSEGLGISGFTLGVLSIILAGWLGIITSATGFIFCRIQQKDNPTKLGKIGIVLNIIGFVISIIFIVLYTFFLPQLTQQLG